MMLAHDPALRCMKTFDIGRFSHIYPRCEVLNYCERESSRYGHFCHKAICLEEMTPFPLRFVLRDGTTIDLDAFPEWLAKQPIGVYLRTIGVKR